MRTRLAVLSLIFLLFSSGPASAAVFKVTNVGEFAQALKAAETNGEDDTIYVRAGTYKLEESLYFRGSEAASLSIIGDSAATTILDGGHRTMLLSLTGFREEGITVRIANLTFLNAFSEVGALHFYSPQADVILENCRFTGNENPKHYPGAAELFTEGAITLVNNLFLNNHSDKNTGAVNLQHGGRGIRLLNNTFAHNTASESSGGVFINANGSGTVDIYNNIFYHNTSPNDHYGNDLIVYNFPGTLNLYNNLFSPGADFTTVHDGTIHINKKQDNIYNHDGNITGDPRFSHPGCDAILTAGSPCINAGKNDVGFTSLPATDFAGNARIVAGTVDLGANEFDPAALPPTMPAPTGRNFFSYSFVTCPLWNAVPRLARPLAVGNLRGGSLNLQAGLAAFSSPVDLYLAIQSHAIADGTLLLVDENNNILPAAGNILPKWRSNVSGAIDEAPFGIIPISLLPAGRYDLYLAAVPAGETDFSHYFLWATSFNVNHQ